MSGDYDYKVSSTADLVGMIPTLLGYEPEDHQVVVTITYDRYLGLTAGTHWDVAGDTEHTASMLAQQIYDSASLDPRYDPDTTRCMVGGYGPAGQERALLLSDAMRRHMEVRTTYAVDAGQLQVLLDGGAWSTPEPLDNAGATWLITEGRLAPRSRDDQLARFEPHPTPTFGPLPATEATKLDRMAPSARVAVAEMLVDRLGQPAGPRDPAQMATLAHIVLSHPVVRDCVLMHATQSDQGTEVILDLYRGAPPEQRSRLAAAAAFTHYFGPDSGTTSTKAILAHAEGTLGELMRAAVGIPPNLIRGSLFPEAAATQLQEADLAHRRQAAFPRSGTVTPGPNRDDEPTRSTRSEPGRPHDGLDW